MDARVVDRPELTSIDDNYVAQGNRSRVGVFAPAAPGSLGDQAMLEVARAQIAASGRYTFTMFLGRTWPVFTLAEPCTVQRYMLTDFAPAQRLQAEYFSARYAALWAIGADIIDGGYDEGKILKILSLMGHADKRGRNVGIFGSSISDQPRPACMRMLGAMPKACFLARDPISRKRFKQLTGREPELVADIAFLLKPRLTTPGAHRVQHWMRERKAAGNRILAVNAADRLAQAQNGESFRAFGSAFRGLLSQSPDLVLLLFAHDYRPYPVGDATAVSNLHEILRTDFPDRVFRLEDTTHAWEIKALLAEADGLVTARMHAAIAALGGGVAPLCLVYKGKFEGLMQHFELDGLCIDTQSLTRGADFAGTLREYTQRLPALSAQVKQRLPAVLELSRRNFAAL